MTHLARGSLPDQALGDGSRLQCLIETQTANVRVRANALHSAQGLRMRI